jgi:hypothetical protein
MRKGGFTEKLATIGVELRAYIAVCMHGMGDSDNKYVSRYTIN